MKKLKLFTLGLLGASTFMMTSCGDDDTTTPGNEPKPVLNVQVSNNGGAFGTDDITIDFGTPVTFAIEGLAAAGGGADLDKIALTLVGNTFSNIPTTVNGYDLDNEQDLNSSDETTYRDTLVIPGSRFSQAGDVDFIFEITDKNGQTAEQIIRVTVASTTPFGTEMTGMFFHRHGTAQGAFNLIGGTPVAATGDDGIKDMENSDEPGDAFTGSWEALNSTTYVKDNSFDYDNGNIEAAAQAFMDGGSASKEVDNPAVGDIYIAKLRGGSDYALIKITEIDPTDTTGGMSNRGKITFDYKKK